MLQHPDEYADIAAELESLDDWDYLPREIAAVVNDPRSLLLITIPKSGTTWLRYLLVNYAVQQRRPGADRVNYEGLRRFTVERERVREGRNEVRSDMKPFLPKFGMRHLLYQHPRRTYLLRDISEHGGPKLLGYRNVLDYLVSNYYYFHEFRDAGREHASSPDDLIDGYVRYWALCWRLFVDKIMPQGNAALISYDALQHDTATEFTRALTELGVDVDPAAVERAIPLATAESASADEDRRGQSLVGKLDRGSFVRDGSVGQWQDHFDDEQIERVANLLKENRVDPADALPDGAI